MRRFGLTLGAAFLALLVAACGSGSTTHAPSNGRVSASTAAPAATQAASTPSGTTMSNPGSPRTEIADYRGGITPYMTNKEDVLATTPPIPFNTSVEVLCWVPNYTGMASIGGAFYLIVTSPWTDTYAPASQFANGDPVGADSNEHPIDGKVRRCVSGDLAQLNG